MSHPSQRLLPRNRVLRLGAALVLALAGTWATFVIPPVLVRNVNPQFTALSPDHNWTVECQVGDPWVYAPHPIDVLVRRAETGLRMRWPGEFLAYHFELNNDGASLGEWNLKMSWKGSDTLEIFTHGQQQADTTYTLDLPALRHQAIHDRISDLVGIWLAVLVLAAALEALLIMSSAPSPGSDATSTIR